MLLCKSDLETPNSKYGFVPISTYVLVMLCSNQYHGGATPNIVEVDIVEETYNTVVLY